MWKRNACKKQITQFINYACEQSLDKTEFSFTDYLTAMMCLSFFFNHTENKGIALLEQEFLSQTS